MTDWRQDIEEAIPAFVGVTELARRSLQPKDFKLEFLPTPHRPPSSLPAGKMAVYGFWYGSGWLKIGVVGPNSNARYTSQHYNPNSAGSTLAASLLADPAMVVRINTAGMPVGAWIKSNCHRVNVLLDSLHGPLMLALFEAFLHLRLGPRYERRDWSG